MSPAAELWRDLFEAFPPLDPASEYYNESVTCSDVVQWLAENAQAIRTEIDEAEKIAKFEEGRRRARR